MNKEFEQLITEWIKSVGGIASLQKRDKHPNRQKILDLYLDWREMSIDVIEYLAMHEAGIHAALSLFYEKVPHDQLPPIPNEARGKMATIKQIYRDWATEKGLLRML